MNRLEVSRKTKQSRAQGEVAGAGEPVQSTVAARAPGRGAGLHTKVQAIYQARHSSHEHAPAHQARGCRRPPVGVRLWPGSALGLPVSAAACGSGAGTPRSGDQGRVCRTGLPRVKHRGCTQSKVCGCACGRRCGACACGTLAASHAQHQGSRRAECRTSLCPWRPATHR